jgi:signal transduction histidine kinase
MRERIETLGGTFALDSAPGLGTSVEIALPLNPRKTSHVVHPEGIAEAGKK